MESRWQHVTIASVSEKIGIGPFGSSIPVRSFVSEGVPVISVQHLRGSRLEDKDFNFVSPEHANGWASSSVRQEDMISMHVDNIAQVTYIPETSQYDRYVVSQRQTYMGSNRPWYFLSTLRTASRGSASCCRGNMLIKSTRSQVTSINSHMFDTFTKHVHGVDMSHEGTHDDAVKVSAKELGYGA